MIGWIHCFGTKADRLSYDRDCHLGVVRKQKEKEEKMEDRQQPGTRYGFFVLFC